MAITRYSPWQVQGPELQDEIRNMRDDFHETRRLVHRDRATDCSERERSGLVRNAFVLALLLGLADPRDLGLGVDDPRNRVHGTPAR